MSTSWKRFHECVIYTEPHSALSVKGVLQNPPHVPGYPCQSLINYVLIKAVAILHTTQGRAMRNGNSPNDEHICHTETAALGRLNVMRTQTHWNVLSRLRVRHCREALNSPHYQLLQLCSSSLQYVLSRSRQARHHVSLSETVVYHVRR